MEANFKELLAGKDKEIITLTNKLRMVEQKKDKEISELKKDMASAGGSNALAKDLEKQQERYANIMLELESTKSQMENLQVKLEESELKIQELEYDKEILLLQADLATDGDEKELTMEELKQNYGYIKMAFTRLEEKYELEKAEWEL